MAWRTTKAEFRDVAQELTNRIADMIESTGKVPWKREWNPDLCAGPQAPVNAFTGEIYHGFNSLHFSLHPQAIITADPRFATFKQAEAEHCHVKKGAKGLIGIYYKPLEIEDKRAEDGTRIVPLLKSFHVFHSSDIEGLPAYKPPTQDEAPWTRPEAVCIILKNSGVPVKSGGDRAFYSPTFDFIQLPPDVAFTNAAYWSATAVHELNHATGHHSRMNRDMTGAFGSEKYSQEEARVEMAATFVCNTLGLPTDFHNSAAYVAGWLKKIRTDKRELFHAAADAQRIADYTLAWHPDFAAKSESDRPCGLPTLAGAGSGANL